MQDLAAFVAATLNPPVPVDSIQVEKLFGQASARQYFRAHLSRPFRSPSFPDTEERSVVIMKMPNGFASPAEEVTKLDPGAPKEFSFLNVQKYLKGLGVRVPSVLAVDESKGLVILEDLGDRSLESLVKDADGEYFVFYYKKVLDVLVDLQVKTGAHQDRSCVAYHRRFTEELLNWEFAHFAEYGIEDRFGITLSPAERELFRKRAAEISARIAALPQGFTHRDFQSRNLMFKGYDFYLIDFQDALVGPVLYDLVGLLRDSYVLFSQDHLHQLLEYYYSKLSAEHPYSGKLSQLKTDFHLVALQRKLKDAGRFQYIKTVKGNPGFLPHVPLSLSYVRMAFASLSEYDDLRVLIAEHVPELR
jgi:aminoglycoside/choline kinase family phosphotransferase